jgi:putative flippase GtrA
MREVKQRAIESREVRFLLAGGWNTVFGLGVFAFLQLTVGDVIGYPAVLTISTVIAVLQSHLIQRRFVWHSTLPYGTELLRFSSVYVVQYAANLALLALAVEVMELPVVPSQVAITAVLIVSSYVVHRFWTFRHAAG